MSRPRRLPVDPPEINLVPLLDMVSLLIQLLLINAQFGVYAEVGSEIAGAPSDAPPQGLLLEVRVQPEGYSVMWSDDGVRRQQVVPCLGGSCSEPDRYDVAALRGFAADLKGRHPSEVQVLVAPGPDVPFDVMVRTMDALRESPDRRPLFPKVILGDLVSAGGEG
jgi:biopolymer transport protein TolR